MVCYDGHTTWVNTKALQSAGITKDTPDPKNGEIVRDPKTGEPTGVLKEAAQQLVSKVLPPTTRVDRLRAPEGSGARGEPAGVWSVQNASEARRVDPTRCAGGDLGANLRSVRPTGRGRRRS
jgi:predicted amidohydrolase YtcJ